MAKVSRAPDRHKLPEKRHKRSQGAKTRRQWERRVHKCEHKIRRRISNQDPKPLVQLFVGEAREQLGCMLEGVGNKGWYIHTSTLPLWSIQGPIPFRGRDRVIEDISYPLLQLS